jgi:hypothetical protein
MFSFLNSIILFGLAAAAIPLLIHLLARRRLKKVYFSSLTFLKSIERSQLRWLKVKQLLLLLIRTLIVIFLVLAFARPALKSQLRSVGAEASSSAVVLLDNSYSMARETRDGSLFELARGKAEEILDLFGPGDEVAVTAFSDGVDFKLPPFSSNKEAVKGRLQELSLSHRTTDVVGALLAAVESLKQSSNLTTEIYLLTDLTENGWREMERLTLLEGKSSSDHPARLYLIPFRGPDLDNLSVGELDFGRQLVQVGKSFKLNATVTNYTERRQDRRLVSLFLDGRRVAQSDVTLPAGGEATVDFTLQVDTPGLHYGRVELEDDELLADNSRYFSFRIPEAINVLVVGENPQVVRHIRWALNPSSDNRGHLRVSVAGPKDLPRENLSRYQVIFLAGLSGIEPNVWEGLKRFSEAGGGLFFSLGSDPDLRFYNEDVAAPIFGVQIKGSAGQAGSKKRFFSWDQIDLSHPIFSIYRDLQKKDERAPFVSPKFYAYYQAKTSRGSHILGSLSNKDPILLEGGFENGGKALLLTSSFAESFSDVSMRSFFVPFVNRACEYLAQDLSAYFSEVRVGGEIQVELPSKVPEGEIVVTRPDGERFFTSPTALPRGRMVSFGGTELPGIYRFSSSGEELDFRAVNVDLSESQPNLRSEEEIEKDLACLKPTFLKSASPIAAAVKESRLGRELWQEALFLVLALMGIEMLLARIKV